MCLRNGVLFPAVLDDRRGLLIENLRFCAGDSATAGVCGREKMFGLLVWARGLYAPGIAKADRGEPGVGV